jgi:signal transduction histidine kinase
VSSTIILVTAFVLGDNLRRRRDHIESLAERAERAEREQFLLAQQQVNAERTRIARELHDVVAHSVSVMVIQAAAARRNLHAMPDLAADTLATLEQTGRQTMHELRGILGVLRRDADPDFESDLAPQPTLVDLPALVDGDAGLPIRLTIDGDLDTIPRSISMTGYRLVQEALTNVRRHAGPVEQVAIAVTTSGGELRIDVLDDGRGAAADATSPGFGLIGMRERVNAVGGIIDAGPHRGGGWHVLVRVPLDPARRDAMVREHAS